MMIKLGKNKVAECINECGLEDFVSKILPPQTYILTKRNSVKESVLGLVYDMKLRPIILNMPKKQGCRTGIGKLELIEHLYGSNRYAKEQIEKADPAWLRKTIKYAFIHNCPVKCATMHRLKSAEEKARKSAIAKKKREAKISEFAAKVENAPKASPNETFGVAVVDLTLAPKDFDFGSLSLPMADNALMFLTVKPKDMKKALYIIDLWQFSYIDNAVWNRDFSKSGSDWCDNKHTMILIATKGTPKEPVKGFKLNSVHYERQTLETIYIPDYYYDMIEQMCPGQPYLEVFSHRQYSDSWHILNLTSNN